MDVASTYMLHPRLFRLTDVQIKYLLICRVWKVLKEGGA